jgi:translocation and assembly module TamB
LIRFLKGLAWACAAVALLIVALLFVADTDIGHRFIVQRIAAQTPKSGLKINIGAIDGSIYGKARLRRLTLGDPNGLFFEAPDVTLDWTPANWLSNQLDIMELSAQTAILYRLPKLKPGAPDQPILPSFDIHVGRFAIDRLVISATVARQQRVGRVTGKIDVKGGRALV